VISQQGDNNEVFNRDRGNTIAIADLQELSRRKQMDTIILLYNRIIIHGDHYKEQFSPNTTAISIIALVTSEGSGITNVSIIASPSSSLSWLPTVSIKSP